MILKKDYKGDLIGFSGNTGTITAPHLHYEVRFLRKHVNPKDFLYWNLKTFDRIISKKQDLFEWKDLIKLIQNTKKYQLNEENSSDRTR